MTARVLIVDDIETNRYMLENLLGGYGLEVTSAQNGQNALDKARLNPPDLIVTDILMPVMDGYTLCRLWKSDEQLKHIPFVFYTAKYTDPKDEALALNLGADRFILKPQEPDIFFNILKEVLDKHLEGRQSATEPLGEEMECFRQYNETLFNKLVKKILELEIANQKLKQFGEQYRLSFEHVTDVVFTIDADLNVSSISPSIERILGYKPQEITGRPISDLTHMLTPESLDQTVANISLVLKGGTIPPSVYQFIAKDGTIKFGEVIRSPMMRDGKVIGMIAVARDITERKQAEDALHQRESYLSAIIENQPGLVWLKDRESRFLSVNKAFALSCGKQRGEDLVGKTDLDIWPTELAEKYRRDDFMIMETGKPAIVEEAIFDKGEMRWFETFKTPVLDEQGTIIGTTGYARDITDRKKADDALRQSEEQLRLVTDNMADLVLQIDAEALFRYITPNVTRLFGFRVEELLGKSAFNFVHPDERTAAINAFAEAIEKGHGSFEARILHKDGHYIWMDLIGKTFYTKEGEVQGIIMGGRDSTGRKQAQEELISLSRRLNDIIDFLPDATLVIDKEGRVITWNRAVEAMTGVKAEEMLGKGNYEYAIPFYGERRPILIDLALHPELKREEAYTAIRRSGDIVIGEAYTLALAPGNIHLSVTASVLRDSNGEIIGAIECIRNNTDRKEIEERLKRAEKMESLGVLAGGVAHDLNNVLGVMVGYSELLLLEVSEEGHAGKFARSIKQGGERAAAIIQDLLTMARRSVSVSEIVNLNQAVNDFLNTHEYERIKFGHPGVLFQSQLEPNLFNIKGSPIHLFKTIMNLLSNAAESITGAGEVTIMTENRYVDVPLPGYETTQEGDYAVLTVSDTGSGISPQDLERIFEPFYTKKIMGRSGTGLGLALVWGTVKDHGGYIDVRSEQNKGSTFTLYFPATRETLSKEKQDVSADSYCGGGESILIVDDVEAQRLLAATILENMNYRVSTVASGHAAVKYLKENKADLVVLDMIMDPGIDGLETYCRILEINPHQKAIIVSGFAKTDRVEAAQKLGVGEYIKKPYVIEKLGVAVRKELDR